MIPLAKLMPQLGTVHQLSFNFGVIKLDKSLRLVDAHHIKDYKSSKSVDSLINELLDDMAKGFERFSRIRYQVVFSNLLANLFYASSHGKAVLYSRNNNSRSTVLLNVIIVSFFSVPETTSTISVASAFLLREISTSAYHMPFSLLGNTRYS
jgi:hypothetical protein